MATSEQPKRSGLIMFDERYDADTKVYAASAVGDEVSETFHADYDCHQLSRSNVSVLSLPEILTEGSAPLFPCLYCTLDIQKSIETAVEQDGLDGHAVHPLMDPAHDARPRRGEYE
jgi:hypothetical protein